MGEETVKQETQTAEVEQKTFTQEEMNNIFLELFGRERNMLIMNQCDTEAFSAGIFYGSSYMINLRVVNYEKTIMKSGCLFDGQRRILAVKIVDVCLTHTCLGVGVYCDIHPVLFLGKKIQRFYIDIPIYKR